VFVSQSKKEPFSELSIQNYYKPQKYAYPMQKVVLPNGLTVLYRHKPGNAVIVEVMIKVGSNDELSDEKGIAHFLEHLLFEGTLKRPTNREISNEIEKIGGEFNAYTTNERTCFYVKVLKKHFIKAIDVLSDILQNPLFDPEHIKKEKNIVLKEIDMVNDEPRFYQWILLQKTLFKHHPAGTPTYGDKNIITSLTREKILQYFEKYYQPSNMIISIVGEIDNWRQEVDKWFVMPKKKPLLRKKHPNTILHQNISNTEKRKVANTYVVVGFKTVPQGHKDSYVLEVLNGILGRGQSGKMFTEIRSKRGLAYDVGTQHVAEVSFGYFAVYATVDKKNIALVKNVILEEMKKLKSLREEDLKEAKDFIEGDYLLDLEDVQKISDQLLFWEQLGKSDMMDKYISQIKKVTLSDIKRVIDAYFKHHAIVVLEGK